MEHSDPRVQTLFDNLFLPLQDTERVVLREDSATGSKSIEFQKNIFTVLRPHFESKFVLVTHKERPVMRIDPLHLRYNDPLLHPFAEMIGKPNKPIGRIGFAFIQYCNTYITNEKDYDIVVNKEGALLKKGDIQVFVENEKIVVKKGNFISGEIFLSNGEVIKQILSNRGGEVNDFVERIRRAMENKLELLWCQYYVSHELLYLKNW